MPGGYGRRFDANGSLGSAGRFDRPMKPRSPGSNRTSDRAPQGTGGTIYPTVIEAYNRDSDYKRWRAGADYWQGSGQGWSDIEQFYLVRLFRDLGVNPGAQLVSATYFPSDSSPDASWVVTCRRRGAVILPQLLRQDDIVLDTSHPNAERHRLILDVSQTLTSEQLETWGLFVGDQFEDSATGTGFPSGLIEEPIDTIAYTLVEVDKGAGKLLFDLSRPFMRSRPNSEIPRAFWGRIQYDRRAPMSWRNNGSRYLCSSHRFYCSCPDFSGYSTASLQGEQSASQALFPRPSAGRGTGSTWERASVGYLRRWRDLSFRVDQRRECKHIHATRWSVDYPFYEPSDYEIGNSERHFTGGAIGPLYSGKVMRYHQQRGLTLDRLAPALADAIGVLLDAGETVSPDEEAPAQPGRRPVLWTTEREPAASRAVSDDWWLQIGTATLRVFDPAAQRFVETKVVDGQGVPVVQLAGATDLVTTGA